MLFCTCYQPSGPTGTSLAHTVDSEFQEWPFSSPSKFSLPLSLPFGKKFPYLSVLKRVVIRQNNNSNNNSCNNSVQRTFISILKMGKLRSRDRSGWPSSITEGRKADLEPVSFDYHFDCQSLDQQSGVRFDPSRILVHRG